MFSTSGLKLNRAATALCAAILLGSPGSRRAACAQQNPKPAPPAEGAAPKPASSPAPPNSLDESQALIGAIAAAQGNPQTLIKNLEDFLARFPSSPHRDQVLRTILTEALQDNDPHKAAEYAEKLIAGNPADPQLLSVIVETLDRENDAASRERALRYATGFVANAEKRAGEPQLSDPADRDRHEKQALLLATGYLERGKIYAKSGAIDKAFADYEKSFAAYPTGQLAERLGDLAVERGETDLAVRYFTTAFAFPDKSIDPAHREELRKKLGRAYAAEYHSEKGLGDLILDRYDDLMRSLKPRFGASEEANAGVRDPFRFVLKRLDGSPLRLADYRGKIVVMDFWATWCGPCRLAGKLLEQIAPNFRTESAVSFLAVNVDEDRSGIQDFLKEEHWTVPVVYAEGLDRALAVRSLPTLMIFDREERVVYRQEGVDPNSFAETLVKRLREALQEHPAPPPSS